MSEKKPRATRPDWTVEQWVAEAERLESEILATRDRLGFAADDVRTHFFNGVINDLTRAIVHFTLMHLAQRIGQSDFTIVRNGVPVRINDSIAPRIIKVLFKDAGRGGSTLWNIYIGRIKHVLFHDVWGTFEDSLRSVYSSGAVPAEQRLEDEAKERAKFKSPPTHVHLSFSTVIWQRLSKLTKANGTTSAQRAEYFRAVDFFSSARNTVHSNTFFTGRAEKTLQLGAETLRLVPGQLMDFTYPDTILQMIRRLVAAFEFICVNIKHADVIRAPVAGLNPWPEPKRNLARRGRRGGQR